jgi:hypothetical protein
MEERSLVERHSWWQPAPNVNGQLRRVAVIHPAVAFLGCWLLVAMCANSQSLDGSTRANWPHYGGSRAAWRFSGLDQVNTTNVRNLVPVWLFQTGDYADGLQSTPIVSDGVMYLITPHNQVFAPDGATGRLIWQYKPGTPRQGRAGGENYILNRGLALAQGKLSSGRPTISWLRSIRKPDVRFGGWLWMTPSSAAVTSPRLR